MVLPSTIIERWRGGMDPVAAAAAVAFGFVYIHPFDDGNGRIHRWLIHHVLARAGYGPPGVIVSAAILREIRLYRGVLESYSEPLSPFIEWRATDRGNVEVLNETSDYYRYFDATAHAEFLYHCMQETVEHDLPAEVAYLEAYDQFIRGVHEMVDMPTRTADLLHRFLAQVIEARTISGIRGAHRSRSGARSGVVPPINRGQGDAARRMTRCILD